MHEIVFWIVFLIVIFRFNDLQFGCSDIEQMVSKHEQMAQNDAEKMTKTMMFLKKNFSNNSAWLNQYDPKMILSDMSVSTLISIILSEKNHYKHAVRNNFLGKQPTCEWRSSTLDLF